MKEQRKLNLGDEKFSLKTFPKDIIMAGDFNWFLKSVP
ncbi:hypothetical protein GM3709_2434 [Geminocystis sp. NIES-3709]|nr:hypothetical protein GM3709_2434 [Geminocystis sp. NIES-3709]